MKHIIGMAEAKSKLAEIVGQVKYGKQTIILQRRGRPMAVLISLDEYERLQAAAGHPQTDAASPLPPALLQRQRVLVQQARQLRERLGAPEEQLADLFADLPPAEDDFWLEVQEAHG